MADQTLALNRRARYDYSIEETFEAGLVLTGTEIKSLRAGKASLAEAYARIENGEAWLIGAHIAEWTGASRSNHEPRRPRKLLLHRTQIDALAGKTQAKGLTLVPLKIYVTRGRAKVELGLGRGKKQYDRRRDIAARDARRAMEQAVAEAGRGRRG
jgi:SsrA-binding protein